MEYLVTEICALIASLVTVIIAGLVGVSLTILWVLGLVLAAHVVVWFIYLAFRHNFIDDVVEAMLDPW